MPICSGVTSYSSNFNGIISRQIHKLNIEPFKNQTNRCKDVQSHFPRQEWWFSKSLAKNRTSVLANWEISIRLCPKKLPSVKCFIDKTVDWAPQPMVELNRSSKLRNFAELFCGVISPYRIGVTCMASWGGLKAGEWGQRQTSKEQVDPTPSTVGNLQNCSRPVGLFRVQSSIVYMANPFMVDTFWILHRCFEVYKPHFHKMLSTDSCNKHRVISCTEFGPD